MDGLTLGLVISVSVLGVVVLILSLLAATVLRRYASEIARITEQCGSLSAQVPEHRLQVVEQALEAFRTRIDSAAIDNDSFRERVHKSLQRFDQIMRRNEKALLGKAGQELDKDDGDGYPDQIPLGDVRPQPSLPARMTKAELRRLLREKEGR